MDTKVIGIMYVIFYVLVLLHLLLYLDFDWLGTTCHHSVLFSSPSLILGSRSGHTEVQSRPLIQS